MKTKFFALILFVLLLGCKSGSNVSFPQSSQETTEELEPEANEFPPMESANIRELLSSIEVFAERPIREIPDTIYGTNVEWVYSGYGVWDNNKREVYPEVVRLTRELGITLIRFPGGGHADVYHWVDGIGPVEDRPTTPHLFASSPTSKHVFGTNEALHFADVVGGELLITVNIITGTADEATKWIEYVNKPNSMRVKYWEIGNESYGQPHKPESITPQEYIKRFREFAPAMLAANPNIKIGGISGVNLGRRMATGVANWNELILTNLGNDMDFVAVHNAYYPMPVGVLAVFEDGSPLPAGGVTVRQIYSAMLAAPLTVERNLDVLQKQIVFRIPTGKRPVIAVTEWGPYFHAIPQSPVVDHVKTLGSAVYVADVLRVFIECRTLEIANFFKLLDNAFMGWIGYRNGELTAKAPYYAFQMYTKHFGSILVNSKTSSPTYDSPALGIMDHVRGVPYLEAICSKSKDDKKLYILVINKHFDQSISAKIKINDFVPNPQGTAWTLSGTAIDANTGTELPQFPGLTWATQASIERFHRLD